MGLLRQFFPTRQRKPLAAWKPFVGKNEKPKRHKGIEPENVDRAVWILCSNANGIDGQLFTLLHTSLDLDALYDLYEMRECSASWEAAARRDAEE